jgi:putative DNA primase/helicase
VTDDLAARYLSAAAETRKAGRIDLSDRLATRARQLRARRRVDNTLYLAARRELAFNHKKHEWDANPWVLGVANGVVDLRDGTFRAGRPDDYIRCAAPVEWRGLKTPAPLWRQFLRDIFNDDVEMINFVQRLQGYAITGLRSEHRFPILYGEMGRNGKGTMLEAVSAVLGDDLTMPCPADALMEANRPRSGEAASPFLYSLRGKRLVWASESKEGRRINTDMIKLLCGGDKIPCRPLFGKATKFTPTHTLFLLTNTKPRVPADDQPVWDRILLIPFRERFVDDPGPGEHQADKEMLDKLTGEASGILAWLVRGCVRWQKYGLNPPDSVKAATKEYRQEEDVLAAFLAEECCIGKEYKVRSGDLYKGYSEWARERNETPMTGTAFGRRMAIRFKYRESHGRVYLGLGLLSKIKAVGG